ICCLLLPLILLLPSRPHPPPASANCPIYLTISLAGKTLQDASLEINWGPDCYAPPEWIGIYREDPTISSLQPEQRIVGIEQRWGRRQTDFKLGKLHFPGGWNRQDEPPVAKRYPKGICLPYYAASYNGTELLTVDCLKIQPNWLAQLKDASRMPFRQLFLPGSHAAGAYVTNYSKTKSLLVKDYLVAQHFDVWTQLVFGIRYLDLSVGYRSQSPQEARSADNFWLVNENMFINPLRDVLRDVRRFALRSQEPLVLDFSSFPIGFYKHPEVYSDLYQLIRQELADVAYERNVSLSENCAERNYAQLQRAGRQVLLLFPTEELPHPEKESSLLCPPWQRFSAGFMNVSQTLDYMRLLFSRKPDSPVQDNDGWVFLAVKSIEQALNAHKLQTAKERAALVNPKVSLWLNGPWGLNANVVAMDYFSSTNLVDLAIRVNARKAFQAANGHFINIELY
ncbi:hypothetical protein KR222_008193, partial [Zaprionus bogoriensis]